MAPEPARLALRVLLCGALLGLLGWRLDCRFGGDELCLSVLDGSSDPLNLEFESLVTNSRRWPRLGVALRLQPQLQLDWVNVRGWSGFGYRRHPVDGWHRMPTGLCFRTVF